MYITPDTSIAEIVYQYPELVEPLHKLGLYCFSWGGRPAWGTLALQASLYGIENINGLINELNSIIENNRGKKTEKEKRLSRYTMWEIRSGRSFNQFN